MSNHPSNQIDTWAVFISVHTPKTGGSSVIAALSEAFGNEYILGDYADDPANPISRASIDPSYFTKNPIRSLGKYKVVHGHFPAFKYKAVEGAFRMTFLRDPVENLVSIHHYWMSLEASPAENPIQSYCRDNQLSVIDLAEIPALRYLYSKTYFGMDELRSFDFVGNYSCYNAELERLESRIGIPINKNIWINKTSEVDKSGRNLTMRQHNQSDKQLLAELSRLLKEDIDLYETYRGK